LSLRFRFRWAYRRFLCRLVGHRYDRGICVDCLTLDPRPYRRMAEKVGAELLPAMQKLMQSFQGAVVSFKRYAELTSAHDGSSEQ
jgi:hypothetical protein